MKKLIWKQGSNSDMYRQPPKEYQFKKGQSGNPNGRPKGKSITKLLMQYGEETTVDMTIDGEKKKVSKYDALVAKIWDSALKGDVQIAKYLVDRIDGSPRQTIDQNINANIEEEKTTKLQNDIARLKNNIAYFWGMAGKPNPAITKKQMVLEYGGRSGGKSYVTSDECLGKALERKEPGVIICGREIQKSIKDSSKQLLEDRIKANGLEEYFEILETEIRCIPTGVRFIFLGMREATRRDGIKGIVNAFLFWGDEAQQFSQNTLDKLIPTIKRVKNYKMIFTMNRDFESDPVFIEMTQTRKEECLIISINYDENPYCPQEVIDEAETMKITNYPKWEHIYGGKPQTEFEDSLWSSEIINKLRSPVSFERANYSRVVVALDPATTDKEYSNEYGIQVAGMTKGGEGHHIQDVSGHYDVNTFAHKAIDAYYQFEADAMVIETNQGGDFIKNTILTIDPRINIIEVRAGKGEDKATRAKPIANLAQMGRIRHICGGSSVLENQMKRITTKGFIGASGESPDRVDAYVWAFIDLFGLTDLETAELFIKSDMFVKREEGDENEYTRICYTAFDKECYGAILFDITYNKETDKKKMVITDYFKGKKEEAHESFKAILDKGVSQFSIPEDITGTPIINQLSQLYANIYGIDSDYLNKKPVERVTQVLPFIASKNIAIDKLEDKTYDNQHGNLFIRELTSYTPTIDTAQPILLALCNALFIEMGIE